MSDFILGGSKITADGDCSREIKRYLLLGRKAITNAGSTTLMAESEEGLKSLLMRVKEESGKAGLKLNTQKTKFMASSTISSRQVDGEKWKQWSI